MVGHYRILTTVGAGGMGTVYKAIDTRLNRPVAIKAIQEPGRLDDTAIKQLRAEALAAASLDHPYICKIYELFETGNETLIVMEFVEGRTLRAMMRDGRLPIGEVMRLAGEIAEGLANAHELGLVHRDVKPANVMVTPHGHVKLLDFGLARADATSTPDAITRAATSESGAPAGTVAYMAPEQALGEPLTARADLFALGVVMFECLAGELPFDGTTTFAYARALIEHQPKPLGRLAPDTPPELVRLVTQCLSKEPSHRPDSAAAVATELREIAERTTARTTAGIRGTPRRTRALWLTGAALGGLAIVSIVISRRSPPSPGADAPTPQQTPFVTWPSEESSSRASPDGRFVSFLSNRDGKVGLFIQSIDGGDTRPVTLPPGDIISHAWSPDGREFACVMRLPDGAFLEIVPAPFGGAPRQSFPVPSVSPSSQDTRLLRWIGDAVYLQSKTGTPGLILRRVDLKQATLTDVSARWKVPGNLRSFDVAPDGQRVVFSMFAGQQEDLWLTNIDGSSTSRLTDDKFFDRDPLWVDAKTVIFQSNRGGQVDLWAISATDRRTWPLTSGQAEDTPNSVSADGSLITFQQISQNANLWLVDPATGSGEPLTGDALSDYSPTSSKDGVAIVFQRTQPRSSEGFALLDSRLMKATLGRGGLHVEPQPLADGFSPKLSADGSRLAYLQRPSSQTSTNILRVKDLRTGIVVMVSEQCSPPGFTQQSPVDWASQSVAWTADGQNLLFIENAGTFMIRRFRTGTGAMDPPLVREPEGIWIRDLYPSADGRTVAYLAGSRSKKIAELHALDLSTASDRILARFPAEVWTDLQNKGWTHDDRSIVLVRRSAVYADKKDTIEILMASAVDAGAAPRRVAIVEGTFFVTTRLDAERRVLYLTRSEGVIHNLYAVSLATGALRRMTNNQLPAVSFSGVECLPNGRLLCVRDQKRQDIWIIRGPAQASK